MGRVLYVSRAGTPIDAPGIRIYNIAKVLRELGYQVDFICDKENHSNDNDIVEYDGFNYYYNIRNVNNNYLKNLCNIYELCFSNKIYEKVIEYCKKFNPSTIILYNGTYFLTKKLIKFCGDFNIQLITDVTEWYEKRNSGKVGEVILPYLIDRRIRKLDRKVDNIISISPYLHNYYKNLECNSIFVPPIFSILDNLKISKYHYYSNFVLNLVYAGSPSSKDILNPILDAVYELNKGEIKVRLDLIGINETYLKDNWKYIDYKKDAIFAHGRLPHNKTLKIVQKADFGILLRHNMRYSKAGFSTKFAECMSNGVPMICNDVGGTDTIIDHMNDGVVIKNYDVETLVDILGKLIKFSEKDIVNFKENAYSRAFELFNAQHYKETFMKFIK